MRAKPANSAYPSLEARYQALAQEGAARTEAEQLLRRRHWLHQVGEYGVKERYTRVSAYQEWLRTVMQGTPEQVAAVSTQQAFLQPQMKGRDMVQLCRSLRVDASSAAVAAR